MHAWKKKQKGIKPGGGPTGNKTAVWGARERESGQVTAHVVADGQPENWVLASAVHDHVEKGSVVYTDAHRAYEVLGRDFDHDAVNHSMEYVRGNVHTNGIENFWALLKRGLHGTYVQVAPEHLFRYVGERVFTYNGRTLSDLGRFSQVLTQAVGRRLTWEELTA